MASGRRSARNRVKSLSETNPTPPISLPKIKHNKNTLLNILSLRLKTLLLFAVFLLSTVLFLVYNDIILLNIANNNNNITRVITPFPAPKIMDLPQFQGEHKECLYWGTYRPHVYLGIRARTPQSLVAGLMWIGIKDGRFFMRHVCQDSDELKSYGWTNHNGRDYGHQILIDHDITLMTSFLKSKEDGSGYGGDWALRVDMEDNSIIEDMEQTSNLFFYLADEAGDALSLSNDLLDIRDNSLLAYGSRKDIGGWQLHLKSTGNITNSTPSQISFLQDDLVVHYAGFKTPHIHNLSELVQQNLGAQIRSVGRLELSDTSDDNSNILVFQITSKSPFKTDVAFVSGTHLKNSRLKERISSLTGTSLSSRLDGKKQEFDEKFNKSFNLNAELDAGSISTGKAAIGNLLGGIGYFYGQSKVSVPKNSDYAESYISYWPAELYTAVPSRPFFPRGFLWDEGFHQLSIWRWDISISLDIIGHWLDLMNIDGWIPREQILGAEARSKVPEEFVLQHPTNGNPPTLFLVLHDLVTALERNHFTPTERDQILFFLERSFVRLEAWFRWFNTTQSGKVESSYFWHGRDTTTERELNPKSLSSGLDDYPRASHPSEDERHLDLRCWMLLAADSMYSISKLIGKENELGKEYGSTTKLLSNFETLNKMHFDDSYGAYFDFGNHTEKVRLSWREVKVNHHHASRELVREVMEDPKLRFVPHIGYVSFFPFMGRIIPPESPILEQQLNLISNRSIMWTDYGLRSLSKTSSMYMKRNTEHDAPYWRGPIWMNMNYLILSSLHHYSKENGPYQEKAKTIYNDLRSNLISNVVKNYQETGYFWEQYDQKKGKGKGARLFTGWTSLVLLIMAEAYSDS